MNLYPPRRKDESLMDYAIRTMDPKEIAEVEAAAKAAVERIMAAGREAREAESRRQVAAAPAEGGCRG